MRINVRVIPRSSKNTLEWEQEGTDTLKAHLTTPPVDGAANAALIALLAEKLGLPKRRITVVRGTTTRHKVIEITDLSAAELAQKLQL